MISNLAMRLLHYNAIYARNTSAANPNLNRNPNANSYSNPNHKHKP